MPKNNEQQSRKKPVTEKEKQAITDLVHASQSLLENVQHPESDTELVKQTASILLGNPGLTEYRNTLARNDALTTLQRRFLLAFCISGIITNAAIASGITPSIHRNWIKGSAAYREAFVESEQFANDYLENLALELASGVHMRPVVSMGKIVTYEKIFDTKLLLSLLKARMPHKFSNRVDITSNGNSIVKLIDKQAFDAV